jgi:hypothetical protein
MAKKINDDSAADVSRDVISWEEAEMREMRESEQMFVDYARSLPADGSKRTVSNFIRLRRVKLDWRGYDVSLEYNMRVNKPHLYRWERNGAHDFIEAYDRPYVYYDFERRCAHGFIEAYDRPDAIYELSQLLTDCWFRL